MNTKIYFILLGLTGLLAFAFIVNPVSGSSAEKLAEIETGAASDCLKKLPVANNCISGINILKVTGDLYQVSDKQELIKVHPGIVSHGYFKTSMQGQAELSVNKDIILKLYPETEILLKPYGPKWPGLVNCYIYEGEVDIITHSSNKANIRVLTDGICVNPGKVNFKMIFNPEIGSGEVVVKKGILRVTSDREPTKFFSVSTLFGIDFVDGKLKVPHRILLKDYRWVGAES